LEAELFESYYFKTKADLMRIAEQIYEMFIKEGSELEINISQQLKKKTLNAIVEADQDCFQEAKEAAARLMETAYMEFSKSPAFALMRIELRPNCIVYTKKERNAAVKILLKSLDKSLPQCGQNELVQQHIDLVRDVIHEFCKKKLHVDFTD
jgi:hypothetical protein